MKEEKLLNFEMSFKKTMVYTLKYRTLAENKEQAIKNIANEENAKLLDERRDSIEVVLLD